MDNVLIRFSQGSADGLCAQESLQAILVLASFDFKVSVLFEGHALALLKPCPFCESSDAQSGALLPFKPLVPIITSFEFYDLAGCYYLLDDQREHASHDYQAGGYTLQPVVLTADFLDQFDHVIHW